MLDKRHLLGVSLFLFALSLVLKIDGTVLSVFTSAGAEVTKALSRVLSSFGGLLLLGFVICDQIEKKKGTKE
jgi:hypothetical protein